MRTGSGVALVLALLLAGTRAYATDPAGLKAGIFNPARDAPDFLLRGSDGKELSLKQYRGKVVVLGFGYTHCADVCPVTLAVLADAQRKLGTRGAQVQVIYLTVDPERDNAARLKEFLASFDPTFVGGTGTVEQMAAVRKSYGVSAERHGSGANYGVSHSSFVYLISPGGKLRALMPYGHKADDFVHDLNLMLN